MNKSENIFKKLKFVGISKKEHDQTIKVFKELDRDYKAVFKKEPIAFNPFQGIKIHKSAFKRSKRKSNQKKKSMEGGMWQYIAMAIALGCLAKAIFQNQEQDRFQDQPDYHGRVPEQFRGRRAYPPSYQPSGNFPAWIDTSPGNSDPHRMVWSQRYHERNELVNPDELTIQQRSEIERDIGAMQSGVDGFQGAIAHRDHIHRDGGEFDRAAQRFLRPVIRAQGQQAWDDDLSQAPGAAGSHFGSYDGGGGGGGGGGWGRIRHVARSSGGGGGGGLGERRGQRFRSDGDVATATDNLFGTSESGYN
jgi:hypothetical protein